MRDCIFLLADRNMEATFSGFLGRPHFHASLQCRPFNFDPKQDVIVDASNDSGVYTRAHELLRPFLKQHHHAVVVLDEEWEGSPGAGRIKTHISRNMIRNGWKEARFAVCVIAPELENWIWQDSPHVAAAFRHSSFRELHAWLHVRGLWTDESSKPSRPKEAIEEALRANRIPRSSTLYRQVTERVSVRGCTDPAFQELCTFLRSWFPAD